VIRWIVGAAALLLSSSVPSHARPVDLGGFVGYHSPIDQDDATDDAVLGLRGLVPIFGGFAIEPRFTYFDMDRGPYRVRQVPQEVQEWSILATTLHLRYTVPRDPESIRPYAVFGAGYYFLRKEESPDADRMGLQGGIGLELPMRPGVELDVGAEAVRISLEQGGARATIGLFVGLNFHAWNP
jgi:hypothetical protein